MERRRDRYFASDEPWMTGNGMSVNPGSPPVGIKSIDRDEEDEFDSDSRWYSLEEFFYI